MHLCLIGCGNITARHAKLLHKLDKTVQLSFASRDITKAQSYQERYHGVNAYGSYDDVMSDAEITAVMINTPPDTHLDLAIQAINSGKHVIVEKPPFMAAADFDKVGPMADEKGVQLCVAENYYYKPLRTKLEQLLKDEVIGRPLFMHLNATKYQKSKEDWRDDPTIVKYGALYEGGIHWISLINNIGLEVVSYEGFQPKREDQLERSMQATAVTDEGMVINLLYSWEVRTIFQGLRLSKIHGTHGSITFETNGIFMIVRGKKKKMIFPGLSDIQGTKGMFKDFIRAIKQGVPPQYTWQLAQKDLRSVEACYRTSKNRHPNL